jgi:hypothetical protein
MLLNIGSTQVPGIHAIACRGLCEALGLPLGGVELCASIRPSAPNAEPVFHSCGTVRPAIPDPVEMGVQILNPVRNIEADVSLENPIAMWQAWQGQGAYP